MSPTKPVLNRNIILVVGRLSPGVAETIAQFNEQEDGKYRLAFMYDKEPDQKVHNELGEFFDILLPVNFNSPKSITKALKPYELELRAVTCRSEARIPHLQKVIPHVPYIKTPSSESLEWATDKIEMRKRLQEYDKKISPKVSVISDGRKETIEKVEKEVGYPLVIKPAGLASSLLVTICYHREELEKSLRRVLRKIGAQYKEHKGRGKPQILVEQFMEGQMYSTDAFVNSRGKVYFSPMVSVKTGREIGFDDFFGYQQMTPTLLSKESIADAQEVSRRAIHALRLRSSTAHVELMKTEKGWKVIELGPRVGGFRHQMYELSFGINTTANDIYIRIPKIPRLPRKVKGYTAAFKFFAKSEGSITTLKGIKKIKELDSFHSLTQNKRIGDTARFAKHGGKSVFNVFLFNKDRSKLLADIRRMEQFVTIKVGTKKQAAEKPSVQAREARKVKAKAEKKLLAQKNSTKRSSAKKKKA